MLQWYGFSLVHEFILLSTQEPQLSQKVFFNQDMEGKMHFPGFGDHATEFLITQRQIAGVGIDTHGIDSGQDTNFTINRLLLERSLRFVVRTLVLI